MEGAGFRQQCRISTRSGRGGEGGSRVHQLRSLCEWQCQNLRSLRGDGRDNSQIGVRATSELLRQNPTRAIGPVSITHTPSISRLTCRYNEQDPAAMARLVYLHVEAWPPSSVFFYQSTRASPRTFEYLALLALQAVKDQYAFPYCCHHPLWGPACCTSCRQLQCQQLLPSRRR